MQKNLIVILMFLTLSLVITSCYKSGCSAKDSDSETNATTDSTSDFSTDSDSGSVTDTQTDTATITDTDTYSDIDSDTAGDSETETDTDILGCLAGIGNCSCYGECEDGFGYTMYYPDTEDPGTDNWMSPSPELSEAGIAWYFCSVCESCGSFTKIKDSDGQWTSVSKKAYCQRIIDVNNECNNCLVTASGGGG